MDEFDVPGTPFDPPMADPKGESPWPAEPELPSVSYLADEQEGAAGSLATVAAICADRGTPLRLRISISLWNAAKAQYASWKGQSWRVDVRGPEYTQEAHAVREALEECLSAVARKGAGKVAEMLRGM